MSQARVEVRKGRALPLWLGHPWVFSGAVKDVHGAPASGDVVEVVDEGGRRIGEGFFNPASQIRVRLLAWGDARLDDALLQRRVQEAAALRRGLLALPNADTDAFRAVNAEGDGLPGLVVDHYAGVLVVQFGSVGLKRREGVLLDALERAWGARAIVELPATGAEAEGVDARPAVVRGTLGATAAGPDAGEGAASGGGDVAVRENGLAFRVAPLGGQKTGWFCDQRENRARFARWARGAATVLDVYCYAGGFGLCALRAGAGAATLVDASARALERGRAHAAANGLEGRADFVEEDAFRYLAAAAERGQRWEAIVLDPPKFARSRGAVEAALRGYRKLHAAALRCLADGGLLATSSCTTQVRAPELQRSLGEGAYDAGRRLQVLEVSGAAPDHPIRLPCTEGDYLTFVVARA